jgi:cytidylate kinase
MLDSTSMSIDAVIEKALAYATEILGLPQKQTR